MDIIDAACRRGGSLPPSFPLIRSPPRHDSRSLIAPPPAAFLAGFPNPHNVFLHRWQTLGPNCIGDPIVSGLRGALLTLNRGNEMQSLRTCIPMRVKKCGPRSLFTLSLSLSLSLSLFISICSFPPGLTRPVAVPLKISSRHQLCGVPRLLIHGDRHPHPYYMNHLRSMGLR